MYYSMKIDESRPFCLWGKHLFKQRFHGIFRKYWNQNWKFTNLSFNWQVKMFIRAGGTLFSDGYFSLKKGIWMPKISWLFLFHYELSENPKKKLFFHSVLRWSRRCGPSLLSSNIQEPCPIRVKGQLIIKVKFENWKALLSFPKYCHCFNSEKSCNHLWF